MKTPLDFTIKANNDIWQVLALKNPDGTPFTDAGVAVKWQAFTPGTKTAVITKRTSDGSIVVVDLSKGWYGFWINATDTKLLAAADYPHEAVTVDSGGKVVTVTNNDFRLTFGKMTIVDQYTIQD